MKDMFGTPLNINDIVAFPDAYSNKINIGRIFGLTSKDRIKIVYKNRIGSKRIIFPKECIRLDQTNSYLIEYILLNKDSI
jgi:hypothetical protein